MIKKTARFSLCRKYRYSLKRIWKKSKGSALFVCLNPSTADENVDDPTIRRCIRFAESWGYGGMIMCNLIPFRSTNPKLIYLQENRPMWSLLENERFIKRFDREASVSIAAWGVHGKIENMGKYYLKNILSNPHYLELSKDGFPKHPLYLRKELRPIPFKQKTSC